MARTVRHLRHPSETVTLPDGPPVLTQGALVQPTQAWPTTLCGKPVDARVTALDIAAHLNPPVAWYVAACKPCLKKLASLQSALAS